MYVLPVYRSSRRILSTDSTLSRTSHHTHLAPEVLENYLAVLGNGDGAAYSIVYGAAYVAPVVIEGVVAIESKRHRAYKG